MSSARGITAILRLRAECARAPLRDGSGRLTAKQRSAPVWLGAAGSIYAAVSVRVATRLKNAVFALVLIVQRTGGD